MADNICKIVTQVKQCVTLLPSSVIMSGEKSKSACQTDGKAAQNKMSEMGMMSYKVQHTKHTPCALPWRKTLLSSGVGLHLTPFLIPLSPNF